MASYRDLLRSTKTEIEEVDARRAQDLLDEGAVLVDVRERDEWEQGRIPGAVHVPRGHLEARIEQAAPDRSRPVLLYSRFANCKQPRLKGLVTVTNSRFNGRRMEDVWLDR